MAQKLSIRRQVMVINAVIALEISRKMIFHQVSHKTNKRRLKLSMMK